MAKRKKTTMDVVFLLDRSGSMGGMETDTIGGYNSYLESLKDKDVRVTTVLFDNNYEVLGEQVPIKDINKLTEKEYFVRGCTALHDAIGKTIKLIESKNPQKVMFIITTDGLENASHEYNKNQIKEMILGHKGWEFMYIGADIDSYSEGSSIGIETSNISNYKKDRKGVSTLFGSLAKASCVYYDEDCVQANWKEELEEYIQENKA